MAVNFVKFVRGTPAAFKNAVKNKDTLYFIAEAGESEGELYLGDKLLSGGEVSLNELTDVIISNVKDNQLLVYNYTESAWVNKSVLEVISIMQGPTNSEQGAAGLVPPPGIGQYNYFLKGDGTWGLPEVTKETIEQLEQAINKKAESTSVYTKKEVDEKLKNTGGVKRKLINSLDEIDCLSEDAELFIYVLATETDDALNQHSEYIVVNKKIEQLGSSAVDLEGYVTQESLEKTFEDYTEKVLDNKVDKKSSVYEGEETEWTLLSPENQKKLSALVIGQEGLEVSGTVNADNVQGLTSWIADKRDVISGLISIEQEQKLNSVETGAQKNVVNSVEKTQFGLDQHGNLSIISITVDKIKDLDSVMLFSSLSSDFSVVESGKNRTLTLATPFAKAAEVGDLKALQRQVSENSTLVDEVNYINERLKWQNLK